MDEKLYTLNEARTILAREACLRDGHELEQDLVKDAFGKTVKFLIYCMKCKASFKETTSQ